MSFFQERVFRVYSPATTLEQLSQQVQDLRFMLNSAVQDLALLKDVLEKNGRMDAALYKQLRMTRMLQDHSGAGADPWVRYSIYPYTLDEPDFLRQFLDASEAEVQQFKENVEGAQTQT